MGLHHGRLENVVHNLFGLWLSESWTRSIVFEKLVNSRFLLEIV